MSDPTVHSAMPIITIESLMIDNHLTIRVTMAAVNELSFSIMFDHASLDYSRLKRDICEVVPCIMDSDAAWAEYYDDAGRSPPPAMADRQVMDRFVARYEELIIVHDIPFMPWSKLPRNLTLR
jgi:hypothetical protein